MRLLFDQNLSPRLVSLLADLFPDSVHARELGLQAAKDKYVWRTAKQEGYVLVSKDKDFHERSLMAGHPPKVIWIRLGNCSTDEIASLLRRRHNEIQQFVGDEHASLLTLG